MIWSIAWKNVWRNKRRSLVVIVSVTLGIISGVLLIGIFQGWIQQRLDDAIYNEVSHVQIHNKEFINNEEIVLTVDNLNEISPGIDSLPELSGWVKRSKIIAMANTPWASAGMILYGIDPEKERQITEIHNKIVPGGGNYLSPENPGDLLISDKTAEILRLKQFIITDKIMDELTQERVPSAVLENLKDIKDIRYRSPGEFRENLEKVLAGKELNRFGRMITDKAVDYRLRNRVQVTLTDLKGIPVQSIFRVCGIYKTTNTGFDQASVFVNSGELATLCGSEDILTHEIAILLNDIEDAGTVKEKLNGLAGDNVIRTWKELAPDAALMNDFMIMYYFIFIGIIMMALAFGIINTMLMAILERTKELGMLMAIGMNRKRVFFMIMLETIFLTFVGALAGMLSGWAITTALGKTGIHFTGWGEGFEAIGFAAKVYPIITPGFLLFTTIMVLATAILSSIWPARKALKLNPVEALRTE